jgi:hypothetical protein
MLLVDVELGRMMDYRQITPHLTAPPQGFDSCHGTAPPSPHCYSLPSRRCAHVYHGWSFKKGVAATPSEPSDFVDDEYVIYDSAKQQLRYHFQFSPTHA